MNMIIKIAGLESNKWKLWAWNKADLLKIALFFFPLPKFAFRPFQSSVETKSWNRDRFPDKSPVEFQCLDELVIQPQ